MAGRPVMGDLGPLSVQALGLIGYGLIFASTFARRRATFLALDLAGMTPVMAHFFLLGRPAGAWLCAIYVAADVVAGVLGPRSVRHSAYFALYPVAAAVTLAAWTDARDLLAGAGTLLGLDSRRRATVWAMKALAGVSTLAWLVYGVLTGSWAQATFSLVYGALAALGAARDRRT